MPTGIFFNSGEALNWKTLSSNHYRQRDMRIVGLNRAIKMGWAIISGEDEAMEVSDSNRSLFTLSHALLFRAGLP